MRKWFWAAVVLVAGAGTAGAQQEVDRHGVNARAHAEAVKLAYFRLEDLILKRSTAAVSWSGDVPPATVGGVSSGWLAEWTERGVRARYCTDDPAVPGTLLVWLDPASLMGVGTDHRSVAAAPRLYGRERRTLHWLDSGVAEGSDGRDRVVLPSCMTTGLPSGRAALAGGVGDPWVLTSARLSWERRDAACPADTHRPASLAASEPARVERRRVTRQFNRKGVEVPPPVFGSWELAVDLCERDYTVTETETQSCTYTIEGETAVGYRIVTRDKTVTATGDSFSPWVVLFSTCWTGTPATIPPPAGTPETLPSPTITFPTWVETEPQPCPVCFDGSAFRWRRHTDRHTQFPWDSAPTVQTDVAVTNWITDQTGCTPTPPTVLGTSTTTDSRTGNCTGGYSGTFEESRTQTWRNEIPCGGTQRSVLVSDTGWGVTANNCVPVPDDEDADSGHGDPVEESAEVDDDSGGDDSSDDGGDDGGGDDGGADDGGGDDGGGDGEGDGEGGEDGEGEGGLGDGEDAAFGGDGLGSETADPSDDGVGSFGDDGSGDGGDGDGGGAD